MTGDYFKRADLLLASGASALCIDVAHGHHILVKEVLEELRATHGEGITIIAGNVATEKGINDLADWGANAVRCNIGGGSICSTRIQTGHGVPGFETILQCYQTDRNVAIIADGGLRNSGDIVKAIAAGADCVMLGSLLYGGIMNVTLNHIITREILLKTQTMSGYFFHTKIGGKRDQSANFFANSLIVFNMLKAPFLLAGLKITPNSNSSIKSISELAIS